MNFSQKDAIKALFADYSWHISPLSNNNGNGNNGNGQDVTILFEGLPEEPHFLFFQAEYDTEEQVKELAAGIGELGMTFSTAPYPEACGDDWQKMIAFSRAAWQSFVSWKTTNQRSGQIVIMGRSIGAALALNVAADNCKDTLCLVLDSVFDKTADFFKACNIDFPEDYEPFCNRDRMKCYTKPVLFIHSSRDEYVSISQAEWLVVESRSKATQFQICPSPSRKNLQSTSDGYYLTVIKEFINQRLGRREPAKSIKERLAKTRT